MQTRSIFTVPWPKDYTDYCFFGLIFPQAIPAVMFKLLESNKSPPPLEFKLDQEMPILPLTDLQRCLEILNKLKSDKVIGATCSTKCLSLITLLFDFIAIAPVGFVR